MKEVEGMIDNYFKIFLGEYFSENANQIERIERQNDFYQLAIFLRSGRTIFLSVTTGDDQLLSRCAVNCDAELLASSIKSRAIYVAELRYQDEFGNKHDTNRLYLRDFRKWNDHGSFFHTSSSPYIVQDSGMSHEEFLSKVEMTHSQEFADICRSLLPDGPILEPLLIIEQAVEIEERNKQAGRAEWKTYPMNSRLPEIKKS